MNDLISREETEAALTQLCQKLLAAAEAGDESPEFLGTVASGVSMALEAVHDLIPADAQAALDARDKAKVEEGRVLGLREAAEIVAGKPYESRYTTWPWWGAGNRSEDSDLVQFTKAAEAAILAKIEEADHE